MIDRRNPNLFYFLICNISSAKTDAIKISSYPIKLRAPTNAGEMVLDLKCALGNERPETGRLWME